MNEAQESGAPERPRQGSLPQIRLTRDAEQNLWVKPQLNGMEPFRLPQLPSSLMDRLAALAELFWQRSDRCIGFLLLLHARRQEWRFVVPSQRCSRDSSCWTSGSECMPEAEPDPHWLLGGTFQSRLFVGTSPGHKASVDASPERVAEAVPPVGGLHLVMQFEPKLPFRRAWCFLSLYEEGKENRVHMVMPDSILFDDGYGGILEEASGRLKPV